MNPSNQNSPPSADLSRRQFLRHSSLAVAGGVAAANFPTILGQEKPAINAIVIGVGGRGAGAGSNFLEAAKIAEVEGKIVAVADIFPDQAKRAHQEFGVPE